MRWRRTCRGTGESQCSTRRAGRVLLDLVVRLGRSSFWSVRLPLSPSLCIANVEPCTVHCRAVVACLCLFFFTFLSRSPCFVSTALGLHSGGCSGVVSVSGRYNPWPLPQFVSARVQSRCVCGIVFFSLVVIVLVGVGFCMTCVLCCLCFVSYKKYMRITTGAVSFAAAQVTYLLSGQWA